MVLGQCFRVLNKKINQGWYECDKNMMYFYVCVFNITKIVNYLSNYIDLLAGEGKQKD